MDKSMKYHFYLLNWKKCGQEYQKWTSLDTTDESMNCYTLLERKINKKMLIAMSYIVPKNQISYGSSTMKIVK